MKIIMMGPKEYVVHETALNEIIKQFYNNYGKMSSSDKLFLSCVYIHLLLKWG